MLHVLRGRHVTQINDRHVPFPFFHFLVGHFCYSLSAQRPAHVSRSLTVTLPRIAEFHSFGRCYTWKFIYSSAERTPGACASVPFFWLALHVKIHRYSPAETHSESECMCQCAILLASATRENSSIFTRRNALLVHVPVCNSFG